MRQPVVRPLANGLFLYTDTTDKSVFLYPAPVINAYQKHTDDDLLMYKGEHVDALDKIDQLTEQLEKERVANKSMTERCVEYHEKVKSLQTTIDTMEQAVAEVNQVKADLTRTTECWDEALGALRQAQGRVTELESELKLERKHVKQLSTRLSHARAPRVERPKPSRRA